MSDVRTRRPRLAGPWLLSFVAALAEYHRRDRRFGGLGGTAG